MNLEECLRDVENGVSTQEHADWLRGFCDWIEDTLDKALDRVWQRDEQIAAICVERDKLQAELKQGEISPERKCWTCRHYAPSFVACAKLHSDEVLKCVNNNWRRWEARDD